MAGQITSSGKPTTLDVVDGQGKGGGTITESGANIQLVLDQSNVYLKADEASWTKLLSNASQATLLANKWLETTSSDANFGDLTNLLDISKLPGQVQPQGTLSKGKATTFNGQSAIPLLDSQGGTLYVANTGTTYILGLKGEGPNSGTITFDQYNSAAIPSAPAGAVSLSQLQGQSG